MSHCYNGHALLTQGVVPGEKSPTYAATRDRIMENGEHWLFPEIMSLFTQRLYDNNQQYPWYRKFTIKYDFALKPLRKVINKIRGER